MHGEPISPELVLVDAELGARARALLPDPAPTVRASPPTARPAVPPAIPQRERHYPFWARVTAALWLVVLGILIGGAAIPHAQDRPRVVPKDDDPVVTICEPSEPAEPTTPPNSHFPSTSFGQR